MNWQEHIELRSVQTLNKREEEKCKTSLGLFEVLNDKFEPQHNKTMLLLQYCKIVREVQDKAEEWIGSLRVKATHWVYRERDGRLKTIYDEFMMMMVIMMT